MPKKKAKATSYSPKEKLIMAVAIAVMAGSFTIIGVKAADSLSYAPKSPLTAADNTITVNPAGPADIGTVPTNQTATQNAGSGGGCGKSKDGLNCTGQCNCGQDEYGITYYRDCRPVNMYKGPAAGCECPEGCTAANLNTPTLQTK